MYDGKVHDFAIFKEIFSKMDFSALKVYVDLGFLGIRKLITYNDLYIPYKSSKKHPLTETEKAYNSTIAGVRIGIENAIAKAKSFFILRIENRMRLKLKLDDAIQICAALANLKTNSLIINQ